jgi:hypothetical protein
MAWSSLWTSFIGTLHCLLVAFCLAYRQQETAACYTHTEVMNKRHDLYLMTSLGVVAVLCIYAQYQSIRRRGIYLKHMSHSSKHGVINITFQHSQLSAI